MPEKDLITQNLRVLKELESLTEKDFAIKVGISSHNANKYFSRSIPPPEVIRAISRTFNLDIHKLFCSELNRSNYEEFKLGSTKAVGEILGIQALESIKKLTAALLDHETTDESRQIAADKLMKEVEAIISSASEFYTTRDKLFHYLQNEFIIGHKKS